MRAKKPTLNEQIRMNEAALKAMCRFNGKPEPEGFDTPEKVKRERAVVNPSDPNELEAAVMREVGQVLSSHPKVMFAIRQNSGSVEMELAGGKTAPVWFYRWIKRKSDMTITDFWGMLVDGRMFAIECKERKWKMSGENTVKGKREFKQWNFIFTVKYAGGVGGFVTSAEQALEILK